MTFILHSGGDLLLSLSMNLSNSSSRHRWDRSTTQGQPSFSLSSVLQLRMVSPSIKLDLKLVGLDLSKVFLAPPWVLPRRGSRPVVGLARPWVSPCSGSCLTVGLTPPWVSTQPVGFVFCWGFDLQWAC